MPPTRFGGESGLSSKHQRKYSNKIRRENYDKVIKIQRMIENSAGFQFDPTSDIVKLSNKHFTKDIHKLQSKNLNFDPTFKKLN